MPNPQGQPTGKRKIGQLHGRDVHWDDTLIYLPTNSTFKVMHCNCYSVGGFIVPDYKKPAFVLAFPQYYQWSNT